MLNLSITISRRQEPIIRGAHLYVLCHFIVGLFFDKTSESVLTAQARLFPEAPWKGLRKLEPCRATPSIWSQKLSNCCCHDLTFSFAISIGNTVNNYLYGISFLVFLPVCAVWAEQNLVWRHPLVTTSRWPPLSGDFCHHCLSPKINLQPLAYLICCRWPRARMAIWNIVQTSAPRLVCRTPGRGGCYGRVW